MPKMGEIRIADREPHLLGTRAGAFQVCFRQHNNKLLTAVAAGNVGWADALRDGSRQGAEHEVAGIVAALSLKCWRWSMSIITTDSSAKFAANNASTVA